MRIEQSFVLLLPPAEAWPAFGQWVLLVECLPGASLTGPAVDGELPLRFDVKLGPIAAGFLGSGRVLLDDAARSGRFEGQAVDKRSQSRVKGVAAFSLQAEGSATRVAIDVDYSLSGTLAQFSRGGIMRELASALTAQFAANLAARLRLPAALSSDGGPVNGLRTKAEGLAPALDESPAVANPASPPPATAAVVPLSAWSLLRQVIAARWRRLFARRRTAVR